MIKHHGGFRSSATGGRVALTPGAMYRIAHRVGLPGELRVVRSVVVFDGVSERKLWNGETAPCRAFHFPQGRPLDLLEDQIVDARVATPNGGGRWTLAREPRGARGGGALTA